jgi:serine protease Do
LVCLAALLAAPPPIGAQDQRASVEDGDSARVRAFLKDGQTIERMLRPLVREARRAVLEVREGDARTVAFATLVHERGRAVTKASVLPSTFTVRSYDGVEHRAKVVAIDEEQDLALLEVESADLPRLSLPVEERFLPGQFLVAASGRSHPLGVGVLSVAPRRIPAESGFLGVSFDDTDGQVRITQVSPESAAERHGLKVDDLVRSVDDQEIASGAGFQSAIARKSPGTRVRLRLQRGQEALDLRVTLGARETGQPESLDGERSVRRAGFPRALQHDTVISPWQCGGPLLDLEGRCVAINIARAGRTATLAIPAAEVRKLLEKHPAKADSDSAAPAAPTAARESAGRSR